MSNNVQGSKSGEIKVETVQNDLTYNNNAASQTLTSTVVLKAEDMSKSYALRKKQVSALKNLDLEIKRGEFIAIMGLSGSGKTTLLNMLGCLDKPSSGKVMIDSIDVTSVKDSNLFKVRRDKIGFVFQSFNLLSYLNARENVELAMESTKKTQQERSERAKELLAMVGLAARGEHRPQQLSGGEQQRVAIARALANNPAVILADELTGNLDHKTRNEIMKLLVNLNLKQGTTIIIVTHDKDVAWQTERILRLRNGRIEKEYKGNLTKKKQQLQRILTTTGEGEEQKKKLIHEISADLYEEEEGNLGKDSLGEDEQETDL